MVLKNPRTLACSEADLLLKVLLDLLQLIQAVLAILVHLEMVPNDWPYAKT